MHLSLVGLSADIDSIFTCSETEMMLAHEHEDMQRAPALLARQASQELRVLYTDGDSMQISSGIAAHGAEQSRS